MYRVGDNRWIEQRKAGVVKPSARPEGVGPHRQVDCDVSLFEQTLAAYEGDRDGVCHRCYRRGCQGGHSTKACSASGSRPR